VRSRCTLRLCRYTGNKTALQSKSDHPRTRYGQACLLLWHWPWTNDLDIRTWLRYSKDVSAHQNIVSRSRLCPNRRDRDRQTRPNVLPRRTETRPKGSSYTSYENGLESVVSSPRPGPPGHSLRAHCGLFPRFPGWLVLQSYTSTFYHKVVILS